MSEILPVDVRNVLADPMDSPEDRVETGAWSSAIASVSGDTPDPRSTDDDDGHLEADDYFDKHPGGAVTTEIRPRTIHRYGWKPSLPGIVAEIANTSGLTIKAEVDPRKTMPPVFDQGQLGSCTANATAAAFEHDANLDGKKPGRLSRLWIYWQERKIEGSLGQGDTGAYGSDAYIAAAKVGVPAETDWPYVISTFQNTPPTKAQHDALGHYHLTKPTHLVPQNETQIKQVLSNQQTIAFGFTVYESFEDDSKWTAGKMPIPKPGEQVLGGHEVLLVGYLKTDPAYALVRNSWGSSWGLGGYFLFPWAELLKKSVCSDFRTIVRPAA